MSFWGRKALFFINFTPLYPFVGSDWLFSLTIKAKITESNRLKSRKPIDIALTGNLKGLP